MDVICLLHDSDEYGILRWPLVDIAQAAGISIKSAKEIVSKGVFKGGDSGIKPFTFTPRHAGKDGDTVILIQKCSGPCWFSSRMVVDEWIRNHRGNSTRFADKTQPKVTPKVTPKPPFGDGPTSSSTSSSTSLVSSTAREREKEAMFLCSTLIGENGSVNFGGLWRKRFREDGIKFNKVMLDLKEKMKTEKIDNPGGYADDLWRNRII